MTNIHLILFTKTLLHNFLSRFPLAVIQFHKKSQDPTTINKNLPQPLFGSKLSFVTMR